MTAYETVKYEMFRRVRDWSAANPRLFDGAEEGTKALNTLAQSIDEIDRVATDKRHVRAYRWQQTRAAREALLARLRLIARAAQNMAERKPGANEKFPPPRIRRDRELQFSANLFIQECTAARAMFLSLGMPDDFVEQLKTLADTFAQCTHSGYTRRSTIALGRMSTAQAFTRGLDAVRTLDVLVANRWTDDAVAMAGWKAVRRIDLPRKAAAHR